jgi:hypothetical protein
MVSAIRIYILLNGTTKNKKGKIILRPIIFFCTMVGSSELLCVCSLLETFFE